MKAQQPITSAVYIFSIVFFSVFRVYPSVQLTECDIKFSTYIRCSVISVRKRILILYPTDLCERNVVVLLKAPRNNLILSDYFIVQVCFLFVFCTQAQIFFLLSNHSALRSSLRFGEMCPGDG
jgi:hypothetical protein